MRNVVLATSEKKISFTFYFISIDVLEKNSVALVLVNNNDPDSC